MRFYKMQNLTSHVQCIHLNSTERPHVCPVCGKNYKGRSALSTHFKIHLSKRYECTQCGKKYPRVNELTIHMRTHTGEKPFECHLCDEKFKMKYQLTTHLQNHLGAKHKCKVCSAIFNSRRRLHRHRYEHTGLPYRCGICPNAQYSKRDRFRLHIIRTHDRTPSEEELDEIFLRNTGRIVPIEEIGNRENDSLLRKFLAEN